MVSPAAYWNPGGSGVPPSIWLRVGLTTSRPGAANNVTTRSAVEIMWGQACSLPPGFCPARRAEARRQPGRAAPQSKCFTLQFYAHPWQSLDYLQFRICGQQGGVSTPSLAWATLPEKLQAQLHIPRLIGIRKCQRCLIQSSERRARRRAVELLPSEPVSVREIENFRTELNPHLLGDLGHFVDRDVGVRRAVHAQPRIAIRSEAWRIAGRDQEVVVRATESGAERLHGNRPVVVPLRDARLD